MLETDESRATGARMRWNVPGPVVGWYSLASSIIGVSGITGGEMALSPLLLEGGDDDDDVR